MGKAQSKRSVDITTETKKGPEGGEEVTGKLEKIEDIDQKQVNGDATPQEKGDAAGGGEKKDAPDETEHDKDLTTEKSAAEAAAATTPSPATTNADGSGDQTANETSPKEDGTPAATPVKEGEEISPLAEDGSNKKQKKDKPKKRWSFRSLSFGKKDKSKPKSESTENAPADAAKAENDAAATNGDAAETSQPAAEGAVADAPKSDEAAGAAAAETKTVEAEKKIENGDATEAEQKQMNGQKTPISVDEAAAEQKKSLESIEVVAAAVTSPPAAVAAVSNDTANEKVETIVSNGTADAEKNGIAHDDEVKPRAVAPPAAEESNSKSIPVDEKPHQNGTNGDEAIEELSAATKTLQIEVKTERPNDSNNSTITSTTTITNSHTNTNNTNNTTTITTTIPADNIITNTEQKTNINDDDEQNNKHINTATAHTTITDDTTTNTSDMSTYSSNKSIDKSEEQSPPCKVILTDIANEEAESPIPTVSVDEVQEDLKEIKGQLNDVDHEIIAEVAPAQHNQQQQQAPPPLPITAPPSQVVIFALKDENNETNSGVEATDVIHTMENLVHAKIEEELEHLIEAQKEPPTSIEITDTLVETIATTTAPSGKDINLTKISETVEVNFNHNPNVEVIEVEMGSITGADFIQLAEQSNVQATPEDLLEDIMEMEDLVEDFEAEALNIVDQIERDLAKEEADDVEKEKQAQIMAATEDDINQEQQPIDMDLCAESSQENLMPETLLPPPPPLLLDEEKNVIDSLNECIGKSNEILIDSLKINNPHHNGAGDQLTNADNGENGNEISAELLSKIDKLSLFDENQLEPNLKMGTHNLMMHNLKETIVATASDERIEEEESNVGVENCFVGSNDDVKEMPTAKELKENAAAAEIKTQDLPVTCE